VRGFLRGRRHHGEFDEEVREHLQLLTEKFVAQGMSKAEAQAAGRRQFGNTTLLKENRRELQTLLSIEAVWRDLGYALRTFRKSPGFTAVATLTLALGIGANTAVFSVLESQLWRPLPFPDSERLVDVHVVVRENARQWDVVTNRVYQAWREQSRSLSNLGACNYPEARNLSAAGTSDLVLVMSASSSLFDTLELPLERGHGFLPEEEARGGDRVAILSNALWQNRFASDPDIIGKPITVDGQPYVVIGITAPRLRFEYFEEPAIYIPLPRDSPSKVWRNTYVIGRLAPGSTMERARVELDGILQRELESEGIKSEDVAAVSNLRETWTASGARPLYFFAGAVLFVLLIACVNNAGLLLARGLARQREFALRATLGAGRATLLRQSLLESLLLSLLGGTTGTLVGIWGAKAFAALIPQDALPRNTQIALDPRVLLFALGVSLFSSLVTGILPSLFASRVNPNHALRQGASPGVSASRSQHVTRTSLVVVEVALALVLLFGSGLFLSSFLRLEQAPRGFDAPGALTFRVFLRGDNYAKPDQIGRYFDGLTERLRSVPGIREVTLGSGLPLTGSTGVFGNVNIAGRPAARKYGAYVTIHAVAPNYFHALRMPLLAGRSFDPHDDASALRVAVLNRNAAAGIFGMEDPLGRVLDSVAEPRRGVPREPSVEIIGVVENAQEFGADEVPQQDLYVPFAQRPLPSAYTVVTSDVPRGALLASIRNIAYSLDKDQPIFDVQTMDDRVAASLRGARSNLLLVTCLAAVALILVSVGTFGTVAYFVQLRTQEFGVRLALGATPGRILRHAIGQALVMGAAGVLFGVAVALLLGRVLRHVLFLVPHEHLGMLYGVSIYDPLSMSSACLLILSVLILASSVPARRAMRVDPMVALRYE
jgi:predicted permease